MPLVRSESGPSRDVTQAIERSQASPASAGGGARDGLDVGGESVASRQASVPAPVALDSQISHTSGRHSLERVGSKILFDSLLRQVHSPTAA